MSVQSQLFDRWGLPARHDAEPALASPATKRNPPLTAKGDPLTSLIAEERFTSSGHRDSLNREVLDGLRACPAPVTFHELARVLGREDHGVMKRLNDLRRRGYAEQRERRNCSISGQPCVTWRATIDGVAAPRHPVRSGAVPPPRQEAPVTAATGSAPTAAVCAGCAGAGVIRIDQSPDRYEWCDLAAGESCDAAEKLRAMNPHEVEQSNVAALKTFKLSRPAPGVQTL